jgi:3-methyladenine DNA glycosylase/8-oxoguanine DNA glycosylase
VTSWSTELELVGAGGEPVDLWRTINSHGLVDLPPTRIDAETRSLEATVRVRGARPRTIVLSEGAAGRALLHAVGPRPGARLARNLAGAAAHLLRLDEDLSGFYAIAAADPALAWATRGAGRIVRSATVFEDVVKTICTTNCAWSATERMVGALVSNLGDEAPGGRRAFPTPAAMAVAGEAFYRDVVRAGYRGRYLLELATSCADGGLDLEALNDSELSDDEVEQRLLALPGVGPYAAAHAMMMLGRYSRLILDSWTRPKYARLNGGKPVKDATIVRRFRRYGRWAGLAFWLVLTRDWVEENA